MSILTSILASRLPWNEIFLTCCDRLGTFYNALPGQNRKDLVEEWARETYPAVWTDLEKLGQRKQKEGHRLFKMPKREMTA